MDAGSLWLRYRADDVSYYGLVYAPRLGEDTPARQSIIDLSAHLEELAAGGEGSVWVPESIVVFVDQQGPPGDGNIAPWPGSLDLADAAERGCVLLEGADAAGYLEDVSAIVDDWRGRDRTMFEYAGGTYRVQAEGVLPGDPEGLIDRVPQCGEDGYISADPDLLSWLWSARGIDSYELVLDAECDGCRGLTLDGSAVNTVADWGELRSVEDMWELAAREDLELIELTTDGYVGVPVTIEVRDRRSASRLKLITLSFRSKEGRLAFGRNEIAGNTMSIDGFEEWIPEGY
jgi:hypothetical protein